MKEKTKTRLILSASLALACLMVAIGITLLGKVGTKNLTPAETQVSQPTPTAQVEEQRVPVTKPTTQTPPTYVYYYRVQKKDTLSELCERFLGSGREEIWTRVAKQNDLPNPHLILPGQLLKFLKYD